MPRIHFQLESITAIHSAGMPGARPEDHMLYDELSDSVRHGAERASRKAIKRYLIEASTIERRLDNIKAEIGGTRLESKKIGFDVGFHHALPRVSMKYGVGHGWVKFRMGATGAVGIQYKNLRMGHTEIFAGYDGDDNYELRYRLGF